MQRYLAILLLLASLAGGAAAAPAASSTTTTALSFVQALAKAEKANPTYRMAQEHERAAAARWWQALVRFGPTGNLQFGYVLDNKPMVSTLDLGGAFGPMGGGALEIPMSTNYYSGQLSLSQPLFTGFKLIQGLQLARLEKESARASLKLAQNQLYQDVSDAYFGAVVAGQLAQVTEELVEQTREHVSVVRARFREGSASNYDLLRSEVQLANLQPRLLQARNAKVLARKKLGLVIGLDPQDTVVLTDPLKIAEPITAPLEALQAEAQVNRLELQNLYRAGQMANISHTLAATSNLPTLALTGAWTYYDTRDQGFPPRDENLKHAWQIGLGLNWPFWDNLAAWPKAAEAAARVRESELGRQALADGIRLEVEAAYRSLQAALETVTAQQKTIEQAETGYTIAKEQYASGMMTNIDLLDAQLALNQAKINYVQALFEQWSAQIALRRAAGRTLDVAIEHAGGAQ